MGILEISKVVLAWVSMCILIICIMIKIRTEKVTSDKEIPRCNLAEFLLISLIFHL